MSDHPPYAFSIGNDRVDVQECRHLPEASHFRCTLQGRTLVCVVQDNHFAITCPHEDWLPTGMLLATLVSMLRADRMAWQSPIFPPKRRTP